MVVSYLPDAGKHPLWPAIYDMLRPAAELGGIPVDSNEIVWIAHEDRMVFAAATTLLWDDGEAELRLAGGTRFRDWMGPLDEVVSAWAKDAGAEKLTMRGRKGWARFARAFGWAVTGTDEEGRTMFEKEL